MYKQRLHLWIIVFIIIMIIKQFDSIDFTELIHKSYEVTVNVDADTSVKNAFLNAKSYIDFVYNINNPNMIIKQHDKNTSIDNYNKIENAIFSPIVLYVPIDYEDTQGFYYKLASEASFVNFKAIVDSIINNKTLADLDLSDTKKLKDTNIVLHIPTEGSLYYDLVIEQIYIALNNNVVPSEEEKQSLKPIVDELLSKVVYCNDIDTAITNKRNKNDYTYCIYMGPEFYLKSNNSQSQNYGSSTGYGRYKTVYFEKTVINGYDIFVNKDIVIGEKSLEDIIRNTFLNTHLFSDSCFYRTNGNIKYSSFMPVKVIEQLNIVE